MVKESQVKICRTRLIRCYVHKQKLLTEGMPETKMSELVECEKVISF
jgi:hypothetical protein